MLSLSGLVLGAWCPIRAWRSLHLPPDLSSWLPLAVALLFSNCDANLHLQMFEHSTVTGIKIKTLDDLSHCVAVSGFVFVCMCGSVFGVGHLFKSVFYCVIYFEWKVYLIKESSRICITLFAN